MEDGVSPLRQFRIEHLKVSQRQLATLLEMPESKVCRIERNGQPADLEFIRKVATLCPNKRAREDLMRAVLGDAR